MLKIMYQVIILDLGGYCRGRSTPASKEASYLLFSTIRAILPSNLRASIIKIGI